MFTTLPLVSSCWNSPLLSNVVHIGHRSFESGSLLEDKTQQPSSNKPGPSHQTTSWEELEIHPNLNSLDRKKSEALRPLASMALWSTILASTSSNILQLAAQVGLIPLARSYSLVQVSRTGATQKES